MFGKILIVDDVSTNRIVFKVKLTAAGYNTVMASHGAVCLRLAQTEQPDLILLDQMLPDMSGIDVLHQLKANPATQRIPVVMLSSEPDPAMRLAALQAGAEDYLARPVDDQTMMARLRGLFRARQGVGGLSPLDQGLGLFGMAEPAQAFERPGHVTLVMNRIEAALHLRKQLATVAKDQISILTPDDVYEIGRAHV